jgi:hypothetical protein
MINLTEILNDCRLTTWGAAHVIGAETDEPIKTINARWARWVKRAPESISILAADLEALGYELRIVKKS